MTTSHTYITSRVWMSRPAMMQSDQNCTMDSWLDLCARFSLHAPPQCATGNASESSCMSEITAGTKAVGEGHGPSSCINDATLPISSCCWVCTNVKNTTAAVRAYWAASDKPIHPLSLCKDQHTHFDCALHAPQSFNDMPTTSWLFYVHFAPQHLFTMPPVVWLVCPHCKIPFFSLR